MKNAKRTKVNREQTPREMARELAVQAQAAFDEAAAAFGGITAPFVLESCYGAGMDSAYVQALAEAQDRCQDHYTYAVRSLDRKVAMATAKLAEFVADVQKDAAYALQWGDAAVVAAAEQQVYTVLLAQLTTHGPDRMLAYAQEAALRGARWPSRSTSAMTNLMALAVTAAYADFVADRLDRF